MFRSRTWVGVVAMGWVAVTATACAKREVRVPPPAPAPAPLTVPQAPPPRIVAVALDPIEVPPAVVDPAVPAAPLKPITAAGTKPTPPPTPPPASTPPPVADPPVLQTTRNASGLESRANADLKQVNDLLGRINREALRPEARTVYDEARRYAKLADDAVKERNFTIAAQHAEKALTYALAVSKGSDLTPSLF